MKLYLILFVTALFLALFYLRLRPYLLTVRRIFRVFQDVRRMQPDQTAQVLRTQAVTSDKLVRCDACQTWVPSSRAVRLRSSLATYCSHACLEEMAANKSHKKKAV